MHCLEDTIHTFVFSKAHIYVRLRNTKYVWCTSNLCVRQITLCRNKIIVCSNPLYKVGNSLDFCTSILISYLIRRRAISILEHSHKDFIIGYPVFFKQIGYAIITLDEIVIEVD